MKHEFIDKTLFFPKEGILVIGDLHIGYGHALRNSGVLLPQRQLHDTINDLEKIINKIKERKYKIKKVIFLGDIKHYFSFEWKEKVDFNRVIDFLTQYVKEENIILIKGNHDKFDFSGKKMKNYYFYHGLIFLHGHIEFPQISEERVKTIVIGHLHPSVTLSDKQNIKREKYKCFLHGRYKGKEIFIIPSFIDITEGSSINDANYYPDQGFSIIPYKLISKFNTYIVNENGKAFDFGKVKKLN